jgi:hypothetical protein
MDWVVSPVGLNCEFHNTQPKGNTMNDDIIYSTHQAQPVNTLAELQKMHRETLQRLDLLIELQKLTISAIQAKPKE